MKPLCIAHRGCHWKCFENTSQAFIAASEGEFFGVENDIHLTKDKKWIVHHDPSFKSEGKEVIVKDEKFEDLLKMPLDNEWNYDAFCPSFEEYLFIIKKSKKRPIIEIKPANPSFFHLRKMLKMVKKKYNLKEVTFICFYPWPLMKIKLMHPKQHVQLLVEKTHWFLHKWALFFHWDLDASFDCIDEEVVKKFHKKKLKVNAWTVDTIKEARRLENIGVDYITSNTLDQNS